MVIDITKPNKLTFSVSLAKVDIHNIRGTFRLYYDSSLSIGVSTIVEKGKLVANIPVLTFLDFEDGKDYQAMLEIATGDFFKIPWASKIKIKKGVDIKVETDIQEENNDPYILVTKPIIKETV